MRSTAEYANQRETTMPKQQLSSNEAPKDADFKKFVLYVNAQRDLESLKAIEALSSNPTLKKECHVQDVESSHKPQWMTTLPMIACKEERKAYGGKECIAYILKTVPTSSTIYRNKTVKYGGKKPEWSLPN
jgi:hypothetical protein